MTGFFGTGVGFVVFLWVVGATFLPSESPAPEAPRAHSALNDPRQATPAPVDAPVAIGTRSYGSLEVVDLDQSRPLHSQLAEIVQRSHGRTVVLQTYIRASSACADVAQALPDTRMQRALANVTLVRVDIDEYDRELGSMNVETRTAPWFYKLDGKADPTDAISADAWEANIPENMAPVLGHFVHRGATPTRRSR